jgi:CheY-like chemotaxis protein
MEGDDGSIRNQTSHESGMTETHTTVFVVDDDASVRKSLVRLLNSAGYHTASFGSADE